jgi:hypothetical protein
MRTHICLIYTLLFGVVSSFGSALAQEDKHPFTSARLNAAFAGKQFIVGDIDLDGDEDVVSNSGRYWFNDDGLFLRQGSILGISLYASILIDFDGDGDIDIAGVSPSGDAVVLIERIGNEEFAAPITLIQGANPYAIDTADLDGDGSYELVVCYGGEQHLSVFPGLASGGFGPEVQVTVPGGYLDQGFTDFDQDGDQDVILMARFCIDVLINEGDGTFTQLEPISLIEEPRDLVVGDLDGDIYPDVVVSFPGEFPESGYVKIFTNLGGGGLQSGSEIVSGDAPVSLCLRDIDLDSDTDLLIANEASRDISIMLNDGTGGMSEFTRVHVGTTLTSVQSIDLDGDLKPDLLAHSVLDSSVDILYQQDEIEYQLFERVSSGFSPESVRSFDLNRDGFQDLLYGGRGLQVGLLINDGMGGFEEPVHYASGETPRLQRPVDLNGDGFEDVVTVNLRGFQTLTILLNDGVGGLIVFDEFLLRSTARWAEFLDFDTDGDMDIVTTTGTRERLELYTNDGSARFTYKESIDTNGARPERAGIIDLDHDGQVELVVAYVDVARIDVFRIRDESGVELVQEFPLSDQVIGFELGDIDLDGDQDLVCVLYNGYGIILNNGDGSLSDIINPVFDGRDRDALCLDDINDDGYLDVVFGRFRGKTVDVLLNNRKGAFNPAMSLPSNADVFGLALIDSENDGDVDIIAAQRENQEFAFFRNIGQSSPCDIDFNNDGELNFFDVSAFLQAYMNFDPVADFTGDGQFNFFDVSAFLIAYQEGC